MIMDNQMEEKMEHELEAVSFQGLIAFVVSIT